MRYQLQFHSGKLDYQLLDDGTLEQYKYGGKYQLTFKFVRNDATSSQWSKILKLCNGGSQYSFLTQDVVDAT